MDNENKNVQGNENEITPEQKVKEDIGNKIADAAAEIKEEIAEANGETVVEDNCAEECCECCDCDTPEEDCECCECIEAEPPTVTMKKSVFSLSLIAAALVGIICTVIGFRIPAWIENIPEGSAVATVNKDEITDLDVNYYIYAAAAEYANENSITQDQLADYDWDQVVDGEKLSDTLKQKAIDDAIDEVLMIQKGAANGIELTEDDEKSIDSQIAGIKASYGEDGFTLRARTMGISSIKQYTKMYKNSTVLADVQTDMEDNPDKYYPEDMSVLNDYIQNDNASVKHILIKVDDEATDEEKRAQAQEILDRINNGEDFDSLMEEFNEDTGEPEAGYTFTKGEMDIAFEEASFALKIGDVSDLVKSSYGYHIIKRVPGENELKAYWRADSSNKIKIKNGKFNKLSGADVMNDIVSAMDELNSQN